MPTTTLVTLASMGLERISGVLQTLLA